MPPRHTRRPYVSDFGSGITTTRADRAGDPASSSIAVTGSPIGSGNTGTYNGVSFTNVTVATLDSAGSGALNGFDSLIMYRSAISTRIRPRKRRSNTSWTTAGRSWCSTPTGARPGVGGHRQATAKLPVPVHHPAHQVPEAPAAPTTRHRVELADPAAWPSARSRVTRSATPTPSQQRGRLVHVDHRRPNTLGNNGNVEEYSRHRQRGGAGGSSKARTSGFVSARHHTSSRSSTSSSLRRSTRTACRAPTRRPASSWTRRPRAIRSAQPGRDRDRGGHPTASRVPASRSSVQLAVRPRCRHQPAARVTNGSGQAQFTVTDNTAPGTDNRPGELHTDTITHSSNKTTILWTARATTLTYIGQTSGDFNDPAALAARLTDANNGTPIPSQADQPETGQRKPLPRDHGQPTASGDARCYRSMRPSPVNVSATFGAAAHCCRHRRLWLSP